MIFESVKSMDLFKLYIKFLWRGLSHQREVLKKMLAHKVLYLLGRYEIMG